MVRFDDISIDVSVDWADPLGAVLSDVEAEKGGRVAGMGMDDKEKVQRKQNTRSFLATRRMTPIYEPARIYVCSSGLNWHSAVSSRGPRGVSPRGGTLGHSVSSPQISFLPSQSICVRSFADYGCSLFHTVGITLNFSDRRPEDTTEFRQ